MLRWPLLFLAGATLLAAHATPPTGAVATGNYRNLFREYLGKSEAEVNARLHADWRQFVTGDPDTERLVYPVGQDMAYLPDLVHQDVRTEGMSYGMMIAVQLDDRAEFDRLWRYARRYMYHESGPFRGYFAWHTAYDGTPLDPGPASDGEEWFVTALFFAAHRWGNGDGVLNYEAQAQGILRTMLHKHEEPDHGVATDMINREAVQITFVPQGEGAHFTDPSYHLPAFYALWATWAAAPEDRALLARMAPISRELLRHAAHPVTGLMPDYSEFDGRPRVQYGHEDFRYDAWRTLANPALDHSWWAADPWQVEQSNRVLRFIASRGPECPDRMKLDGTPLAKNSSAGLYAMAAVAALAADRDVGEPFVRRLWDAPLPTKQGRYYDGLLTLLARLQVGGQFRVYAPAK